MSLYHTKKKRKIIRTLRRNTFAKGAPRKHSLVQMYLILENITKHFKLPLKLLVTILTAVSKLQIPSENLRSAEQTAVWKS